MRRIIGQAIARLADARGRRIIATNPSLAQDLSSYLKRTKSTGCSYADFGELYRTIRTLRPAHVLELGTGASTVVIAHALKANGSGLVTSMEEDTEYFQHAQDMLPPHLAPHVEIHCSPAVEKKFGFLRGSGYEEIPQRPYEFVFVDGPSLLTNPNGDLAFNADLLEIVQRSDHPISALVDTRHATCYVYHLLFGARFRYDYIRKLGVLLPSSKDDLRTPTRLVREAIGAHRIKRPPLLSYALSFLKW